MTTGSSDALAKKTINWTNRIIPAHGFFLFGAGTLSVTPDATYSAGLTGNDGVMITDSSDEFIDKVAWGTTDDGDILTYGDVKDKSKFGLKYRRKYRA